MSAYPSAKPTSRPSRSLEPSKKPSSHPTATLYPSYTPTRIPSKSLWPSSKPSLVPTISSPPTSFLRPSVEPTYFPSGSPTNPPSKSSQPSLRHSTVPTTSSYPSESPTSNPSNSVYPTVIPSVVPTRSSLPTTNPSQLPTTQPSLYYYPYYYYYYDYPSSIPSKNPTIIVSDLPSKNPTIIVSDLPSKNPTIIVSDLPSKTTTITVSDLPSTSPTTPEGRSIICQTKSPQPSNKPSKSSKPSISLESTYRCPNPGDDSVVLPSGKVVQIFISEPKHLCTLNRLTSKHDGQSLAPVSRSYDGNEWENVAGNYYDLHVICGKSTCTVNIPAVKANSTDLFLLTGFNTEGRNINNRNEIARFLEQTTFGPTRDTLNSLEGENVGAGTNLQDRFAAWVKEQMISVKPTIHREYYRKRAYTRVSGTVIHGQPSHPCDNNTRWTRFALNSKEEKLKLEVSNIALGSYLLSIDGVPRTEVDNVDMNEIGSLPSPGSYVICEVEEAVGGIVKLRVDGACTELLSGNPAVEFTVTSPPNVFAISVDFKDDFAMYTTTPQDNLIHLNYINSFDCIDLTIDNAWPSFVLFSDGDWLLFNPQLSLKENTPENPIPGGGGNIEKFGAHCSNVPRTFLNAESCQLSHDHSVCSLYDVPSGFGTIVCGSPSEVANDPLLGDRYGFAVDFSLRPGLQKTKWSSWFMIALHAKDQLRQRMAWALSQILAVSPLQISRSWASEIFLNYYDIFVKHAFGNYRDILNEVSYSVIMAQMLTYQNSRSTAYNKKRIDIVTFPDENYAREIMQLFTIGTVELNIDGTPVLDKNGDYIHIYDNKDIISFARAWTGFRRQDVRGNIELIEDWNRIDPMFIDVEIRDMFPKMDLYNGYIGDGYPLCRDYPSKSFLRKGAMYRLLASEQHPELQVDGWDVYNVTKYVPLERGSSLYDALCNSNPSGLENDDCSYKSQIVLDHNLPCHGIECKIDTLRVVQVDDHIFYEYLRMPCVEFAFFNATKIATFKQQTAMCADPGVAMAMEACCPPNDSNAVRNCQYTSERVTYATAESRCQEIGAQTCDFTKVGDRKTNSCNIDGWYWESHWTNAPCDVLIKINNEGDVSIIHQPDGALDENVPYYLQRESPTFFRVNWKDDDFPSLTNGCGNGACEDIGGMCLCNTIVFDEVVWSSLCSIPTTSDEVMAHLHVGSASLDIYDDGEYEPPIHRGNVKVYLRSDSDSCDINTIIEVEFHGERKYFKNMKSIVHVRHVDGSAREYSFRNTPHFINFLDQYERDAHYETDAVLDHYFHHKNVAPFLALRFIQRFGISNPSPRYIKTVATAFTEGNYRYSGNGLEYGSGKYGDLGATVAAIILEREARSVVLDADPAHGSLREPLLKLIAFMRAMEYQSFPDRPEIQVEDVDYRLGQMAHELPSVFSFFLPEYSPPGLIHYASLVSPEAQLYVTPYIIGLLNGFISMVKWGLTKCYSGLGPWTEGSCRVDEGNMTKASGNLTFTPTGLSGVDVVDELATLLTGGRLNNESRRIIADSYDSAPDSASALRLAQQLITTTAEFNTNYDLIEMEDESNVTPSPTPSPVSSDSPYKAVIYILMDGGVDSFNVLVPHSDCHVDFVFKDMFQEYKDVRGEVALAKEVLLPIDATGSGQMCAQFGLNPGVPILKELYDENDLLFFANVGVLLEPVNKENYKEKTRTQLFAHNHQKRVVQQVDPKQEVAGTGILGRMSDALAKKGYKTGLVSVSGESYALVGEAGVSPPITFVSGSGINSFNLRPTSRDMDETIRDLNKETTLMSGLYGKSWNEMVVNSIASNDKVNEAMQNADIDTTFPKTYLGDKLRLVARMIKSHESLDTNRDVFFVRYWGFDSHSDVYKTLNEKLDEFNDAIRSFVDEMKSQGMWDSVALIGVSEFGRTITPNGGDGTDHGWSGNYFLMGGNVTGGQILGQYPTNLTESGPLNVGRGRLIPTTSWDQIWNGIAQWFDINEADELDRVLPNRKSFPNLFTKEDLFV